VKLLNEKLSELRRQLYRQATDDLHKQVLKGTRWLLLKDPDNFVEYGRRLEKLIAELK